MLEAELRARKIKHATLAKHLNLSNWIIGRKLRGDICITIGEAEAIRDFLQVNTPLEILFGRNDGGSSENIFSTRRAEWIIYPALKAELELQRITATELAKHLGLSRPTFSRKLQGKVSITSEQKAAIRDFLQVDTPLEELFKRQ